MPPEIKSPKSSEVVVIDAQHTFIQNQVNIPGSKSHTIRALLLAGLANGKSTIYNALDSGDTQSCINLLQTLGIEVHLSSSSSNVNKTIEISSCGMNAFINPNITSEEPIYLGNSGTSLYFATALAGLSNVPILFDGDNSLRTRSALTLLEALETLGAHISMKNSFSGCLPYSVHGPIHNGNIYIECSTSQYLSALILTLSLVKGKSNITAKLVGEFPYVEMTLSWLKKHNIHVQRNDSYSEFNISGSGIISPFTESIPGDFSSAAFFLGITAITGNTLYLRGLKEDYTQADMAILSVLQDMGCNYSWEEHDSVPVLKIIRDNTLIGGEFDLSNIPDSLPILSVVASYASSPTKFYNVAHARKKETDRITVMVKELACVHVNAEELEDGLIIHPSKNSPGFQSGEVHSHHDHRIAMAFACGALAAQGPITIYNADVASITFPDFFIQLKQLGVNVKAI